MTENGIIFVFVDVVYTDVSVRVCELMSDYSGYGRYKPLKIIGARVFVLLVWTEGTDVARGVVD